MKVRVFKSVSKNGKPYWSVSASNKSKPEDKGTYFFSFSKDCGEPKAINALTKSGTSYSYADIDILECKFGWFNNSPSIFVFKCVQADAPKDDSKVEIKQDDLPFFGG